MAMKVSDSIIDQLLGDKIATADDLFGKDGLVPQLTKALIDRCLES